MFNEIAIFKRDAYKQKHYVIKQITLKFLLYVPVRMPVRQNIAMYCRTGPTYGTYNRNFRVGSRDAARFSNPGGQAVMWWV